MEFATAAVTVTVVPLTVQADAPPVMLVPCAETTHIGVELYPAVMVIVQLVDVDMEHVPPKLPDTD